MKILRAILAHILARPELYLFPFIAVALIVGALEGIPLLTGRNVQDSPAAIVGFLYNFAGVIIASLATGLIQRGLIGFRNRDSYDLYDALCTLFLFVVSLYFVFR